MANKFDIDINIPDSKDTAAKITETDVHLLNETFHVFSKSPGSPTTTLGGARLKSGHTTTASDVWADEIPAFFKAATQAKFELFATKAVEDDLCLFNGNVYKHNGTEFISLGTEAAVLVDGATFSKNGKPVVKFHKERTAINLTADNNNGDGSNNYTAKIYNAATGSTAFVPQFISAMDKVVDGIPSLAYDAAVFAGGSQLAEGLTEDNDYICNAYAGVIQFNKARSSGVTVSAWEYIGDKLNSTVAALKAAVFGDSDSPEAPDLSLTDQVNANTTAINILKGADTVSGSVAHSIKTAIDGLDSTSNGSNGISVVQTDGIVSTTITVATVDSNGTITSGQTNVVTATGAQNIANAAATAAITAALADTEGSAITEKIESEIADATLADGETIAETTDSDKLVTVEDVKTYVEENAKVTLNQGTGITVTPNATASTEFTVAIDGTVALKSEVKDVADDLSEVSDKVTAIETSLASGAIHTEIEGVRTTANAAKATADTAVQTVEGDTYVTATKTGTKVTLATQVSALDTALAAEGTAIAAAIAAAKTAGTGAAATAQEAAEAAQAAADAAQGTADQAVADAADAQAAADKAQGDATQALADAAAAQTTANQGVTDAATAQAAAEAAQGAADDAQKDATQALTDAATAQAAAEAAQADADALETRMTTAEGAITATTEIITDLKKVSLTKDSGNGLVKVSTVGTIGDGLESITVEVSDSIVETTDTFDVTSTGSSNVEVKLTGTVANPSITVKGTDIASAADLTALTTKVDTHIAGAAKLSIVVASADSNGYPAVETPETNKLYLVAGQGAESGTYVEWIYLEGGTWERIGTTATDLTEYAKTATVTPLIEAAQTQADKGVADAAAAKSAADTAKAAADAAQADADALEKLVGTTSVGSQIDTKLSALTDTTAQGGAGVTLTQTNGRVALTVTSGVVAASGTTGAEKFVKGETVHTAITTAEAAAKKHADDAIAALDATKESAGVKVVQVDGAITEVTVTPGSVAANDASVVTGGAVYTAIKAVSDLVGTTAVATQISDAIAAQVVLDKAAYAVKGTEKVAEDAASAAATAQETADAKIAAVDAKTETYYGAPLVSATTDASKNVTITAAANKEWSVSDVTLTGDTIVEVINGKMIGTGPTIIIDDANLVNGESMFVGQTLMGTFVGNLGKLTNGKSMFSGCTSLVDFCADLGSLTDGTDMFKGCTLSEDSIIYIVDSLPKVTSGTICLGTAVSAILKTEAVNKGWTVVVA